MDNRAEVANLRIARTSRSGQRALRFFRVNADVSDEATRLYNFNSPGARFYHYSPRRRHVVYSRVARTVARIPRSVGVLETANGGIDIFHGSDAPVHVEARPFRENEQQRTVVVELLRRRAAEKLDDDEAK